MPRRIRRRLLTGLAGACVLPVAAQATPTISQNATARPGAQAAGLHRRAHSACHTERCTEREETRRIEQITATCKKKFKHQPHKVAKCVRNVENQEERQQQRSEEIRINRNPKSDPFAHEPPPAGNPDPKCKLKTRYSGNEEGDVWDFTVKQRYGKSKGSLAVDVKTYNPRVVICYAAITTLYLPPGASQMAERVFFLKIKPKGGESSSVTIPAGYALTSYMAFGRMK